MEVIFVMFGNLQEYILDNIFNISIMYISI